MNVSDVRAGKGSQSQSKRRSRYCPGATTRNAQASYNGTNGSMNGYASLQYLP